jgi:hypothetical protein
MRAAVIFITGILTVIGVTNIEQQHR